MLNAEKDDFFVKEYFSNFEQIHRNLQICSNLLKKSFIKNLWQLLLSICIHGYPPLVWHQNMTNMSILKWSQLIITPSNNKPFLQATTSSSILLTSIVRVPK